MNWTFAILQGVMAFVVIFTVTNILMERPVDVAVLYGGFAALMMGGLMGYLSRDVVEHVPNVSPQQAADAAVAVLGGVQSQEPGGAIKVQTGFNYFWLSVSCAPSKGGVDLRGSANHIRYVKLKLLETRA